jgi:hypothetical protein
VRAREDYAREYGEYERSESAWERYYDQVTQQQGLQMEGQKLAESRRANIARESELRNRPRVVGDALVGPTGDVRYQGAQFGADTEWENTLQTYSQAMFGKPYANADAGERMKIEEAVINNRGGNYMVAGEQGEITWGSKLGSRGQGAAASTYDVPGAITGLTPDVSRTPPRVGMQMGLTASQEANMRQKYLKLIDESFDDELKDQYRRDMEVELVRGIQHRQGDIIPYEVMKKYRQVAESQEQAMEWAREDGWNW